MTKIAKSAAVWAALICVSGAAQADLTVVSNTTIHSPQLDAQLKNMSPEQKAQISKLGIGGVLTTKTYSKGAKTRVDMNQTTAMIVDKATKKMTFINSASHTYSTEAYNPSAKTTQAAGKASVSLKDTGKTKVILGHLCRDYHLSMVNAGMAGSVIIAEIWAASDLPSVSVAGAATGPGAAIQSQMQKIKGLPLLTTMTLSGTMLGKMTVTSAVKSISTTPVAASRFAVPAGYKKGQANFSPTAGMMGGGMGGAQ